MLNKILVFTICLTIASLGVSCAQNTSFSIRKIPDNYQKSARVVESSLKSTFKDLTAYLPPNFSRRGDVDYTVYIQKGLDENRKVIFPDFPILINDAGLTIKSNSQIYFSKNSLVKLKASNKERYEIFRLHDVSNIQIFNANISGDRKVHNGKTGEWGMGIAIRGRSKDIVINNAVVKDCWGDGIYLGHLKHNAPENVLITNALIDNCRRNGISITTGKNIRIIEPVVSNTNGTKPECGIVIEPSASTAIFENIVISDAITYNNKEAGIQIGGFEKLLGKSKSTSSISIVNHTDDGSNRGIFVGRIRGTDKVKGSSLKGNLVIDNPVWKNNRLEPFVFRKQNRRGPKITLKNVNSSLRENIINTSDIEL